MIARRIASTAVITALLPIMASFATPALSPSFRSDVFQLPDSSLMRFTSGLDVLGWQSLYQMQGGDSDRFAVTRAVDIRRRDIERNSAGWTFEEDVMFRGEHSLSRIVDLRGWVHADLYSDEFQNQMHWVQQGTGVAISPIWWVEIYPALGVQEDFRQGHRDRGTLVTSNVSMAPPSWGMGSFSWGVEDLGARQNRDVEADYSIRGDFQADTYDQFDASYLERKRAYYLSTSGDIARREETRRSIQNLLGYPLGRGHDLTLTTTARDSRVDISSGSSRNQHREVETAVQVAVQTAWDSYTGELQYEWNAQNQEFDEDRINGTHQALRALGNLQLTSADRISFNASVIKNRFDTPDTLNYDDRDEWSTHLSVVYSRPLNSFLEFSQELGITLDHLVYIFAQRSENNHWRRVFLLGSTLTSTPYPGIVNRSDFGVTATFRDYDFDQETVPRSDVYRRFSALDSLDFPVRRQVDCLVIYRLDLEDRGQLDWSEWIEQISEEYRTHWVNLMISCRSSMGWTISGGWIESLRLGWRYSGTSASVRTRTRFQEIRTSGPTLACHWSGPNQMEVRISGQWQSIKDRERGDQSLIFADINLQWNF